MPTELTVAIKRQATEPFQPRMKLLEGIARGEKAIEDGRTLIHAQAKQRLARWLK